MKSAETAVNTDNLQTISGIGKTVENALHKKNIKNFSDIANRSDTELSALTGISAKRIERENWQGQAKKLIKKQKSELKDEPSNGQHYATYNVKFLLEADNQVRYTHITYVQKQKKGSWAGWDTQQMISFFEEHAGIKTNSGENVNDTDSTDSSKETAQEIAPKELKPVLQKFDVLNPETDDPRHIIHQQQKFDIHCQVAIPNLEENITSEAIFYARDLRGKNRLRLGKRSETFRDGVWDSKMHRKGLETGTYRLEVELTDEFIPGLIPPKQTMEGGILIVI